MFTRIGRTMATVLAASLASYKPNIINVPFYLHRDIGGGGYKKDHTRVRGRDYPQHGARECARRVRQMQKASPST